MKETVDLVVRYQDHTERATFYVTTLGGVELILGHPWLVKHNPEIDWKLGKVALTRCPKSCRMQQRQNIFTTIDPKKLEIDNIQIENLLMEPETFSPKIDVRPFVPA